MNIQSYTLPADWQIKAIEEAYRFTKKPTGLRVKDNSEVPFIPMELMPLGKIFVDDWVMKATAALGSGTYFENGDLLVAKITPSFENGKQAIAKINTPFGYATTEVIPIQEIEGTSDKFYLHFVLLHPEIRKELAEKMDGSTGRQRLRKETLASKQIPFPPLPEQRCIAHVLSTVLSAIEQQVRLNTLTRELKSALLSKLFTEGMRREKQKKTEIGLIPESWSTAQIGSIAKFRSGGTPSRDNPKFWRGGTIPWVKTTEINYRVIETTEEFITEVGLNNSAAKVLPKGTLLVAMYGQGVTRGRVGILGIDAASNQACAAITPLDEKQILTWFLYYYLQFHYQDLRELGHGANQRNLNMDLIKTFPLSFPEIEEQQNIVDSLLAFDKKLLLIEQERALLVELFYTLLHQLMTGQIRVNNVDLPDLS